MNITLRQLEIFMEVQRLSNTSLAAKKLHLSQSAVSMAITELENILNVKLFDRHKKRLYLNSDGQALVALAQNALAVAEEIEQKFSLSRDGDISGILKIGATTTIASYLLPEMMKNYLSKYSNVRFSLNIKNTHDIILNLEKFEIDIGLIEGICHHPELITIPWKKDSLTIFASPSHPITSEKKITFDMLQKAQWIVREPGSGNRAIFEKACSDKLDNLNIILELGDNETIKQAVKTGLGIGYMSQLALKQSFEKGDLVEIKVPSLNLHRTLYVVLHADKYQSSLLKHFSELCLNIKHS